MKNYFKPTLVFASAAVGSPSTCLVQVDLELIADILGEGYDADKIFGMNEACETKVPIDYYCKFTSVELGSEQGFLS
ncbi:MAG: hypothetical protein IJ300_10165 [Clostridia bacterium]|nr:hypothetical protein [Clostridia bacterium]MBQ8766775.1 hypothetical protein [Clostridia bacterium]